MFNKARLGLVAAVLLSALSSTASAGIIYTVSDGTNSYTVDPISTNQSGAAYYSLSSSSGHPAFDELENRGHFWLHENSANGALSLGMMFDRETSASTGSGNINMTTSGFPTGASVTLSDDGGETTTLINGTESFSWNGFNTDGAVIGGLEGLLWTIDITLNSFAGLGNGFVFVNGPGASGSFLSLALSAGDTLTISAAQMPVPEPAPLALVALVFAGLALRRRLA
ncbi:MAG: PEP-CTERM sorting domain-containing protein [Gammaproteobacteria bacterium]|nr:PEP-CTERM sorting domain-containing protein [Gammaproteobacteria bacterium]